MMPSPAPSNGVVSGRESPALTPNNAAAGTKRKRPSEKKFYAVKSGKKPGIYNTWDECLNQVRGHRGAAFKAFHTLAEAQSFIDGKIVPAANAIPGEQKFYAVQNGRKPGVYTDWPSAQAQIRGVSHPRHKKFTSRAEAEAFVMEGKQNRGIQTTLTTDEEIRQLIVNKSAPGLQLKGTYEPRNKNGEPFEIGTGPLPPGAEDGFDPNIRMDESGALVHKTEEEKRKTKLIPIEKSPPGMLRIYTDGSSLRNGTAGARAGVGVFFGPQDPKYDDSDSPPPSPGPLQTQTVYKIDWTARQAKLPKSRCDDEEEDGKEPKLTNWRYRNVSEALKGSKQTNQRAELTAIQRALDVAPRHRDVTIYTDSKYAIDCVTNWYRNWVRNGWVNSKGKPVENKDLVVGVRENIEERELLGKKTFFVWVKGHANTQGNIEADRLANEGARLGRGVDGDEEDEGEEDVDAAADDTISATMTAREGGTNGVSIPGATSEESEDVKLAYEDMARAMEEEDKNGNGAWFT